MILTIARKRTDGRRVKKEDRNYKSSTSTSSASSANPKEIGVKPDPFEGDRAKMQDFVTRIRLYLRANASLYNMESAKITLFLDLCKGEIAGKWATVTDFAGLAVDATLVL